MPSNNFLQKTKEFSKNTQLRLMTYKLLNDTLFFIIIFFLASFFLEAILPGMISQNNGFLFLSVSLFLNIWAIIKIGKELGITFQNIRHSKIFPFALLFSFILIGNSLLKFSLWQNLIITSTTIAILVTLFSQFLRNPISKK